MTLSLLPNRRRTSTRTGWIGIDVGSQAIKIAQVERRGRSQWRLVFGRITEFPAGDDPVLHLETALQTSLTQQRSWFEEPAACVLSSSMTGCRKVELPAASGPQQLAALGRELQSEVALHETAFAHWPEAWETAGQSSVPYEVVSLAHSVSIRVAECLQTFGLRAEVLDVLPYCLARATQLAESGPVRTVAVIDWGVSDPTFAVIRNGQPYFTRVLKQCGFRGTIETLSEGLGLPPEDARHLLGRSEHRGPTSERTRAVMQTVRELTSTETERFLTEVNRTVAYLKADSALLCPEHVYLFGAGSLTSEIESQLAQRLGIPTSVWSLGTTQSVPRTGPADSLLGPAMALSAIPLLQ